MPHIALPESMVRASELIRSVWERRVQIINPRGGQLARPPTPLSDTALPMDDLSSTAAWEDLARLGEDIGRGWRSHLTSTELVSGMRR
jgi:hypothetical protein